MRRRKTEARLYVDKKGRSLLFRNKEIADFQRSTHGGHVTPRMRRDVKAEAVVRAAVRWYHNGRLLGALEKAVFRYENSRKKAKR